MMESALLPPEPDEKSSSPPPPQSPNKSTLLSSLVEGDSNLFGADEGDADLFGSLDVPAVTADAGNVTSGNVSSTNVSNDDAMGGDVVSDANIADPLQLRSMNDEKTVSSQLAFSGLLGEEGGDGGGLFDEIDQRSAPPEVKATSEPLLMNTAENGRESEGNGVMHEMDLNEDYGMGMMGVGGDIPKEEVLPPSNVQHPVMQQQQQQQQQMNQPPQMNSMGGSYYYSTSGAGQMHMSHQPMSHQQQQQQQPSVLAGMHVGHDVMIGGVQPPQQQQQTYASFISKQPTPPKSLTDYVPPPPFTSPYGKITVTDPMLIQGTGLFAGPPHWTFLVTLYNNNTTTTPQPISAVRRRFRHFVALENRLRQSIPGAILPPRPEKHPTRAIEEASTRQSVEFAKGRARELTVYMNALSDHPHAASCGDLKLFLTLQDHIGTAWPEVSGSALTRFTAVGTATVDKLADSLDGILSELGGSGQPHVMAGGEDDAEILALAAYEGRRIGAVTGSVPKIEGVVNMVKERGDRCGATGLEMSKLVKDVSWCDRELSGPMEVLGSALLRSGRRVKRLGLDIGAGVAPFVSQYKLCRYEQMAFVDRRTALKRRSEARSSADRKAAKVMMNQTSMASMGRLGTLEKMEMEAAMFDEMATEAAKEADEIALRLQSEVGRIGYIRVREWDRGMSVVASGMKEACAENAAIWEAALDCFKREFPDVQVPSDEILADGENS